MSRIMSDTNGLTLAPHYYHDNFQRMLQVVQARYDDILHADERRTIACFRSLPCNARCLYVRLVSRSGPWFRESKLHYPEIDDIGGALDSLLENGMASAATTLDIDEAGKLFTRHELQQAFADLAASGGNLRKPELLQAIATQLTPPETLLERLACVDAGRIIAPLHTALVAQLQLLFFGNRRQDLTEFVLDELGVTRYWPYRLDTTQRLFPHREALDEYLACAELSDQHQACVESRDSALLPELAARVLAGEPRGAAGRARWQRLCNNLARDLERSGELVLAASLYQRSQRHPARERLARILERQGNWQAASDLCRSILSEPWCETEQEAARRILPRVERKLTRAVRGRGRDRFPRLDLTLPAGPHSVERQVAEHLAADWEIVRYVENSLMNALFGLAFWEEIFAPVDGVFHHPYQAGPSDMYDVSFRQRRAELVSARMEVLRSSDMSAELTAAYHRYTHYQCRWVDWRRVDAELVAAAARCIPGAQLLAIFQRLLFDPRENRSGFPDLVALGNTEGAFCLIEVKGPGDTLQDSQKRWLRYFADHAIPAQVAWVTWRDA
ncbi:MAG: VRR-NUC domain-containing protein [Halioglobus sp.]|nr:VRR-NUC domain-containing protein [Halioglobus sp.]